MYLNVWKPAPRADRVSATLARMDAEFLAAFGKVNDVRARLKNIGVTPLSLSTITFTGALSQALSIEDMRLAAEIADELDASSFKVDCDLMKRRRTEDVHKRFRYQLPLKRHGKSVKVFHNGSVHSTGCTSPAEFLETIEALTEFVNDTLGVRVGLVAFEVQLINTLFTCVCPLTSRPLMVPPGKFLRCIRTGDFDTERHPSVKISVEDSGKKVATVCVFGTGSVSIMGAKSPAHVAKAFQVACEALDSCAPEVCSPDPIHSMRTTTAKHPLVLRDGYPFNLHSCCL